MVESATPRTWSKQVAVLAVDVLLDAGIISQPEFERAVDIVAEEIYVRLSLEDYPPPLDYSQFEVGESGT